MTRHCGLQLAGDTTVPVAMFNYVQPAGAAERATLEARQRRYVSCTHVFRQCRLGAALQLAKLADDGTGGWHGSHGIGTIQLRPSFGGIEQPVMPF